MFRRVLVARLVDDQACDRLAILFLFWSIDAVRRGVHRETVNKLLYWEVFNFLKVIGVLFLEHGNESAGTCGIDPAGAGVELDHVSTLRNRHMGDRPPGIQ